MLVTTREAAELAGRTPATIRSWRFRGVLLARGRWGRHPLFDPVEVMEAERATRNRAVAHADDLVQHSAGV